MKLSKTLAVILIAGGLSTSAQANTISLDSLLTKLVSTAVTMTADELQNSAKESVANTAHHVDTDLFNTRVEIKEIAATEDDEKETSDE